jgi:hypothetical protein
MMGKRGRKGEGKGRKEKRRTCKEGKKEIEEMSL